jgi:hypothetical protein
LKLLTTENFKKSAPPDYRALFGKPAPEQLPVKLTVTSEEHFLSDEHRARLDRSVIREVQLEQKFQTVTDPEQLRALGFASYQLLVPTLLVPMWDVHGKLATYNHRPDSPRKSGRPKLVAGELVQKFVKYEPIPGSHKILDVPRRCHQWLKNPDKRLWITEGNIKACALASIGECAISLQGVWSWRGTNEHGGKSALGDFEAIALDGREVIIAFDNDLTVKQGVNSAASRLGHYLRSMKAVVSVVDWS